MNSRDKGKRGELEWRDVLRSQGFHARRGQQFSGSPDSPDVVCEELKWLHFEVKRVQRLNLLDACAQAEGDCVGKPWVIAHRRNHAPWFVTIKAEFFFELLRAFEPEVLTTEPKVGLPAQMKTGNCGQAAHSTLGKQTETGRSSTSLHSTLEK